MGLSEDCFSTQDHSYPRSTGVLGTLCWRFSEEQVFPHVFLWSRNQRSPLILSCCVQFPLHRLMHTVAPPWPLEDVEKLSYTNTSG